MVENNDAANDAHAQSVHEEQPDIVEQILSQNDDGLAITARKITTEEAKPPAIDVDSSTPTERTSDATSVRSLPVVQVSEPTSPGPRPSTAVNSGFTGSVNDHSDRALSPHLRTPRPDRRRTAVPDVRTHPRAPPLVLTKFYRPVLPIGSPGSSPT